MAPGKPNSMSLVGTNASKRRPTHSAFPEVSEKNGRKEGIWAGDRPNLVAVGGNRTYATSARPESSIGYDSVERRKFREA